MMTAKKQSNICLFQNIHMKMPSVTKRIDKDRQRPNISKCFNERDKERVKERNCETCQIGPVNKLLTFVDIQNEYRFDLMS